MPLQNKLATTSSQGSSGGVLWTNIADLIGQPGSYAEAALTVGGQNSVPAFGEDYGFTLAEGHNPTGIVLGFWAYYTSTGGGSASLSVRLANGSNLLGTAKPQVLTTTPTFYTLPSNGSVTDNWGESFILLRGILQTTTFGGSIIASASGTNGAAVNVFVKSLPITVYSS